MQDLRAFPPQERMLLIEAAYGKTMLMAHSLERTLVTLLTCNAVFGARSKATPKSRIERIKRLALGQLIEAFVQTFQPTERLVEELDNVLFFRNELAHRISDTIFRAAAQESWEEKVVMELSEIQSCFRDVKPLLQPYVNSFRPKIDLTEQQMLELGRALYPGIEV